MNGFTKHGIEHSSASQINMWEESPAAWVARYLYDKKFPFGVAPQIGVLVEDVVAQTLCGADHDKTIEQAEKTFQKNNALNTNEKELERISNIRDMSTLALEELKQYGEPEFVQKLSGMEQQRIELKCNGDGWSLPVIGFLDFVFPRHGLVIDLKTTLRCPTTMSEAHKRQAAIYAEAKGNMGVKFLYVTPKKTALLENDDVQGTLKQIKVILNRQEKLLRALDKEELKDAAPLGMSSFYWNKAEDIRKELFGV